MKKINLKSFKIKVQNEIEKSEDLKKLDGIYKKYLGKKGNLTQILRSLEKLPIKKRAKVGKETNELKNFIIIKFNEKNLEIKEKIKRETEEKKWIDVTLPGKKPVLGHLHPLTQVKRKVEEIFQGMGFSVVEGPEVETEWYNFDALNIPKDHPARDIWDTFYLKNALLLRTHTSPVQIRHMEKNNPPLRIIAPGKVFRYEATDASHDFQLWQIEGLMIGKDISVANFKAIAKEFFKRFFNKEIKTRLRPGYFPFTEPSFELDIQCVICNGKGCSTCSQTGWLELWPGGMVHPNVLKAMGLNPKIWQGFAFGMGLSRLVMMRYKINDVRLLHGGDLKFLQQF